MSVSRCVCRAGELPSTDCPRHGLFGKQRHPPADRHALRERGVQVETAAEAQRRLYLAAASDRVRVEAAGYVWPLRGLPPRGIGQR